MLIKTKIDQFAWKESEDVIQTVTNETVYNVSNLRATIDQLKADITKRLADNVASEQQITAFEAKILEGKELGIIE